MSEKNSPTNTGISQDQINAETVALCEYLIENASIEKLRAILELFKQEKTARLARAADLPGRKEVT